MLFTKSKGVLLAKGKYILLLDEDDIYVQKDAFLTMYNIAEKYNLDILKFGALASEPKLKIKKLNTKKNHIIFQPDLGNMMFYQTSNGEIKINGGILFNLFIKKSIFIKSIKMIDEKYLNEKMNFNDDYMMFFLLARNAYNFLYIDRIFYIKLRGWNVTDKNIEFRYKEKFRDKNYNQCNSYLNFIEFILYKTKNSFHDKKIAFFSINKWLLNNFCRNYSKIIGKALNISKQYLENKFIKEDDKNQIRIFYNEKK